MVSILYEYGENRLIWLPIAFSCSGAPVSYVTCIGSVSAKVAHQQCFSVHTFSCLGIPFVCDVTLRQCLNLSRRSSTFRSLKMTTIRSLETSGLIPHWGSVVSQKKEILCYIIRKHQNYHLCLICLYLLRIYSFIHSAMYPLHNVLNDDVRKK